MHDRRTAVLARLTLLVVLSMGAAAVLYADDGPVRRVRIERTVRTDGNDPNLTLIEADPNGIDANQPEPNQPPEVEAKTPQECLKLYNEGNYSSAVKGYRKLLAGDGNQVSLAIGLADALGMQGDYAEANTVLAGVAEEGAKTARWQLAMADALATLGQYAQALKHAETAGKLDELSAPAILMRGQLLEILGRKDEAVDVYNSMARVIDAGKYKKDAPALVALGEILDRHAILTGKKASALADHIYNTYIRRAYMEVDEKYWPAFVAAGNFSLTKHRPKTAMLEFKGAAKINKRIPAVFVGAGAVALSQWQFEQGIAQADKALKINPHYADAYLLKAAAYMQWRKFDEVKPLLQKVLDVNPNHIEALSMMAATHLRCFEPDKAQPFIDRVEKVSPNNSDVYETVGEWLSAGRQFDEAEKYYRTAIERAPEKAGPVTGLGLLYMQTGQEDLARTTLARAHELDDFRADVVNYLNVLQKLESFQVRQTEHFVVKVDGEHDGVLLDQVADYMERIYPEVCGDYGCEPNGRIVIEIFPTQTQFSARITGRGWIPTVGACTGRVIALAAPTPEVERTPLGTHNWAVVLRHEFTHAVTLTCTANRIPHWFTEACAVWQQPDKRAFTHVQALVSAVRDKRIMPIADLDWGFIRPRYPQQRHLAYAQSEWALEYIITTRGYDTVVRMLRGFAEGLNQKEVFEQIVGTTQKDFDKEFYDWARKQCEQWGFPPEAPPKLNEAQKLVQKDPKDANAQADLAVAQYYRGQMPQAEATARKALELDASNVRAMKVLAASLGKQKKYDQSIAAALDLEHKAPGSTIAPRVLAEAYLQKKSAEGYARAITALELLKQRMPLDQWAYQELTGLYTRLGMSDKALPDLVYLHRHTMNSPVYARQAAEIYRELGQDDLALDYYNEVLHINPYDASVYDAIASLDRRAGRYKEAVAAIRNQTLLNPRSADAWTKLAVMEYRAWKDSQSSSTDGLLSAREAAQKALALDPESQAGRVLELIEEALKAKTPS